MFGLIAAAGVSAFSNWLSGRQAQKVNEKAIQAQSKADVRAGKQATYETDLAYKDAQAERDWRAQMYERAAEEDRLRWADYVRAYQPYWQASQQALSQAGQILGIPGGGPPQGAPPQAMVSGPPPAAPTHPAQGPETIGLAELARASGPGSGRPAPARVNPATPIARRVQPMPGGAGGIDLASLLEMARVQGRRPEVPLY